LFPEDLTPIDSGTHANMTPPEIFTRRLTQAFNSTSLESLRIAFAEETPILMQQAWLDDHEPGFLPAIIRTAWDPEALLVFAEIHDEDIHSHATEPNQKTWQLGDVFEMFLQASDRSDYVELHVTPGNIRSNFYFSGAGAPLEMMPDGVFESSTVIDEDASRWFVFARIPARLVGKADAINSGTFWRFSFSRYDASRDASRPILSSTSPHREISFHRQQEWGRLVFSPIGAR
jgi:hypothetical protein